MAVESCDHLEVETAYCVRSERCPMMNLPFIDQRCSSSRWGQARVKEEPFICELENVPHHRGGEGLGGEGMYV